MCLNIRLDTLLNASSTGRWWLVGSAVSDILPNNQILSDLEKPPKKQIDVVLDPKVNDNLNFIFKLVAVRHGISLY